jgi:hypothetical protein
MLAQVLSPVRCFSFVQCLQQTQRGSQLRNVLRQLHAANVRGVLSIEWSCAALMASSYGVFTRCHGSEAGILKQSGSGLPEPTVGLQKHALTSARSDLLHVNRFVHDSSGAVNIVQFVVDFAYTPCFKRNLTTTAILASHSGLPESNASDCCHRNVQRLATAS